MALSLLGLGLVFSANCSTWAQEAEPRPFEPAADARPLAGALPHREAATVRLRWRSGDLDRVQRAAAGQPRLVPAGAPDGGLEEIAAPRPLLPLQPPPPDSPSQRPPADGDPFPSQPRPIIGERCHPPIRRVTDLDSDITPKGTLPEVCPLIPDPDYAHRNWHESVFLWKASALCHKPLYFEEVGLERYGHTWGPIRQPFVSGAHFFGSLAILPYKMGIEHPCECVYALGYYRPGSCAPRMIYTLPLSARGALYQAAAVTGIVYVLP